MSIRHVWANRKVSDVQGILETVQTMATLASLDCINAVNHAGEPITLTLVEETLTDGSVVFELKIA